MKRFQDKVALITGSTSGIGRAAALVLAREGAKVVVSGRREREGRAVVDEIERAGGTARFVRADVSNERDVAALVDSAERAFGRLDVAINNAGIEGRPGPLVEQDEDAFHELMEINVKGVWLAMKHELPALERSGGGAIVNVSSVAGQIGLPNMALYCASKAAVDALSRTAALEHAQRKIRINVIAPGAVETDMLARITGGPGTPVSEQFAAMHPMGHIGTADEIAQAIAWLASSEASFVTGQIVSIDGGLTAR